MERSGPMERGEERARGQGRGALRSPRGRRYPAGSPAGPEVRGAPGGRSVSPGCPRGARPSRRPGGGSCSAPPGGCGPALPAVPAPQPPTARPALPAGRRRSGSLRPGLLLSFGALVCFLTRCNAASIFPPALWKTAAEIPRLGGDPVCTPPEPAQS